MPPDAFGRRADTCGEPASRDRQGRRRNRTSRQQARGDQFSGRRPTSVGIGTRRDHTWSPAAMRSVSVDNSLPLSSSQRFSRMAVRHRREPIHRPCCGASRHTRHQVHCNVCQEPLGADQPHCARCGASVVRLDCDQCGKANNPDSSFCARCGQPLHGQHRMGAADRPSPGARQSR